MSKPTGNKVNRLKQPRNHPLRGGKDRLQQRSAREHQERLEDEEERELREESDDDKE